MQTTLNQIREQGPCRNGWEKLLRNLGKTASDDAPLSIITILDGNGLDDAIWCLRAVKGHDREIRLYAVWCAREVQHLMTDPRSINAIDVAERYANGQATDAELDAAMAEAWVAARDAAEAVVARGAAWAARAAAWAARGAAWDAAGAAARDAAWAAAWAAARAKQEARLRELCAECAAEPKEEVCSECQGLGENHTGYRCHACKGYGVIINED